MYASLKKVTENLPKSVADLQNLAKDLIEVVRRLEAENDEKDTIIAEKDAIIRELKEKIFEKSEGKGKQCCRMEPAETTELHVEMDESQCDIEDLGEGDLYSCSCCF